MDSDNITLDKASQESLISVRRWTDKLITFKITRPSAYHFVPGEFSRLGLQIDGAMVWRAFSITSGQQERELEYYAIVVPQGLFSSALEQLRPGDPVWLEKLSYGFMTVDRFADGEDFWMLATGTGLGPYLSILQQREVWQRFRHLVLVHGVRQAAELSYQDQLRTLRDQAGALQLPATLHLVQATTREQLVPRKVGATMLQGRITTLLSDGSLEREVGLTIDAETSRMMVCGNPDMITEVRELLRQRGLSPCRRNAGGQFITEDYW